MAFHPNCTIPAHRVVYVGSPNIRSTLDILWPSLATIIACTYTVLHLNVPEQRLGRDKGTKGDLKWALRRLGQSLKWSCINILAPEIVLFKAIPDWFGALKELRKLHESVPATKGTWTMTHMLFADMGGFVIGYDVESSETLEKSSGGESSLKMETAHNFARNITSLGDVELGSSGLDNRPHRAWRPTGRTSVGGLNQATNSNQSTLDGLDLGPYELRLPDATHLSGDSEEIPSNADFTALTEHRVTKVFHLRADTLRMAIERGLIPSHVATIDEILDKSKNDYFAKMLAMGQTLYYVVEVLTRASRGLPISPMELGVTAFVACSLIIYTFSLQKPKGVREAITIGIFQNDIPQWLRELNPARENIIGSIGPPGCPPNNIETPDQEHFDNMIAFFGSMLIFPLFGAIHLTGWNLIFPTNVDKWLWRAAAISSTVLWPLLWGIALMLKVSCDLLNLDRLAEYLNDNTEKTVGMPMAIMYPIFRLIIIGEMVRCLFYLPPNAFVATWTSNFPHIG